MTDFAEAIGQALLLIAPTASAVVLVIILSIGFLALLISLIPTERR